MDELLVIDRIEGDTAVCETPDRNRRHIPLSLLPPGVREGDCLRTQPDGTLVVDEDETSRRRRHNHDLFARLSKKSKGGGKVVCSPSIGQ